MKGSNSPTQEANEKLDSFLDDLEALRIRAAPDEPLKMQNLEIMRKFTTCLLHPELHQSLLASHTGEYPTAKPLTVEEIRNKCHDYLTLRRINVSHRASQKNTPVTNQSVSNAWLNPSSATVNQSRPVSNQASTSQAQDSGQNNPIGLTQPQNKAPIDRSN